MLTELEIFYIENPVDPVFDKSILGLVDCIDRPASYEVFLGVPEGEVIQGIHRHVAASPE